MKALPIRDAQMDVPNFAAWLAKGGAEMGIPGNPYEVIRYRAYSGGKRVSTHIVYRKESGLLTWTGETRAHYERFLAGGELYPDQPPRSPDAPFLTTYPTERAKKAVGEVTREKLLRRDGDECWFCGGAMGDDCTIEHLVPKSSGGRNMLANYALAHRLCNNRAANLPLTKKIEMRNRLREKANA